MANLHPILKNSYYVLGSLGAFWALFLVALLNPWFQRHALYAHKAHTGFEEDVSNPESFGFAKGQVTPFNLSTADEEVLYCWHVLPLDVYAQNENEIVQNAVGPVDDLKTSVGYKLLKQDAESRVVVNMHGNAGHVGQGHRPSTYRSISGIPNTHLITCDYRGFGHSTANNAPYLPTEAGLITDGISITHYVLSTLGHPSERTVLLGQSLGTAVVATSALFFTDPKFFSDSQATSGLLPSTSVHPSKLPKPLPGPQTFAGIVLVAPFSDLPTLLKTYRIRGIIPVLSPLRPYPRIQNFFANRVLDPWPTLERLRALLKHAATQKAGVHLSIVHARNDQDIPFRLGESVFEGLESLLRGEEGVVSHEERRSVLGDERVKRGAFAYRKIEDAKAVAGAEGGRTVELEVVRYGGHNEVVGFSAVSLAVRRAFVGSRVFKPGLDTE